MDTKIPTRKNLYLVGRPELDPAMGWQLRCTRELIALRKAQPALRGDPIRASAPTITRACSAFIAGSKAQARTSSWSRPFRDHASTATPSASRSGGFWKEIFNSDVYDHWVNPQVAGNSGGISADGPPLHGFTTSAAITIPANGVVVFSRG